MPIQTIHPSAAYGTTELQASTAFATVTTTAQELRYARAFCVQLTLTGGSAPTGTFDVEGSVDGTNFFSLTNGTPASFSAAGSYAMNFTSYAVPYVRGVVTRTSGSATMAITVGVL